MKKIPTTVDRKAWKKWLLCPALALLLVLTSLPVYAGEQKTEVTETPTVTQETGSESAAEGAASSEQDELVTDETDMMQPIESQESEVMAVTDWTQEKPHEGQVLHGGYVGFKNKGTGKYLTVPNGVTDQNTNVCMQSASLIVNAQEFYLGYTYDVTANQAFFRIYSVTSTGASSNIVRSSANSMCSANVKLFSKNESNETERWQIEHVEGNYYCIYLASNPDSTGTRYALTATPGEGSANNTTLTSSGNAVVDVYTGTDQQLWQICAGGLPMDINGYDITQGGSQEAVFDTIVAYYYVPKVFNLVLFWSVSPANMAVSYGGGYFLPKKYGEMTVKVQYSLLNGKLPVIKSANLFSIPHEGKYYIENVGTERYIDIEGPSKLAGAIIQQWDFHAGNYEKWHVVYDNATTGYVRFKSDYSGKYIAVDGSNENVIKQVSGLDDYSLWKVETAPSGNVKLICKALESDNGALSVPLSVNYNGTDLTTMDYTNNSDYYDEWNLQEIKHTYTLLHYYDQGYISRFYDAGEDIELYHDIVAHLLFRCFNVELICNIQSYTSCADVCTGVPVEILDPISYCHHHLNDENQIDHKTRGSIKSDLVNQFESGNKYRTRVAWSGHNLGTTRATSYAQDFIIVIPVSSNVTIVGNEITNELKYDRVFSLLHEVSHQLGAVDHYCYGDADEHDDGTCGNPSESCWKCDLRATEAPICMMSEYNKNSLAEVLSGGDIDNLYCSSCLSDTEPDGIKTHLNDHH